MCFFCDHLSATIRAKIKKETDLHYGTEATLDLLVKDRLEMLVDDFLSIAPGEQHPSTKDPK